MMSQYNVKEVTLRIRCTQCLTIRDVTIWNVNVSEYTSNGDTTYTTHVGECLGCMKCLTPEHPVKKPLPELIALAGEREPNETDVVELVHRIVDDGGEYDSYDLTLDQVERLKRKGHIYFCPSCTRNTILGCADVEDGGYTAAEYHTTLATCTVKDYETYLAMVLKASQSN